jgi:hypothetical protein
VSAVAMLSESCLRRRTSWLACAPERQESSSSIGVRAAHQRATSAGSHLLRERLANSVRAWVRSSSGTWL